MQMYFYHWNIIINVIKCVNIGKFIVRGVCAEEGFRERGEEREG